MPITLPAGEFRAYLFDCDGTIADSMPLHYLAWKQALGSGPEWTRWTDPEATCWSIRQEIQQQLNVMRAGRHDSMEAEARAQVDARMQAISISANLK